MEAPRHLPRGWKAALRYRPSMNDGCKKETQFGCENGL